MIIKDEASPDGPLFMHVFGERSFINHSIHLCSKLFHTGENPSRGQNCSSDNLHVNLGQNYDCKTLIPVNFIKLKILPAREGNLGSAFWGRALESAPASMHIMIDAATRSHTRAIDKVLFWNIIFLYIITDREMCSLYNLMVLHLHSCVLFIQESLTYWDNIFKAK